ncbi:TRAP transporter substrate-binding protein [Sulfitobacter sp. EhC04]|uniref:TRAP transporter substrate-binding protein n=1 Tax=Sulfitobacter sp. EhC04 TaxID=1849168 RepID=UPI0009ED6160|nr:TRAP transporter substrate-binding protein [Sulfitobacter sp. EhC04]
MKLFNKIASAIAVTALSASVALAEEPITLRLSNWIPGGHPMSKYLDEWAASIEERSDGRIDIETYHSGQLGSMPKHYDMVRKGAVDIGLILDGATSDRFPLAMLIDIPFLVDNAVQGNMLVNKPELRTYLDAEHRGVKVLFMTTNPPAQIYTKGHPINTPDDLKGLRMRFPTEAAKLWLEEMGATAVGIPSTEMAEALQKNVIDGLMIDHGSAGIAFKLGGMITDAVELNAYISNFALIMNPDSYEKIPEDLRVLFDAMPDGFGKDLGSRWDATTKVGKQMLVDGGANVVTPTGEARKAFEDAAERVRDKLIAEREEAGLPAAEVYELMQRLAKEVRTEANAE